jgi:hypothetical protein
VLLLGLCFGWLLLRLREWIAALQSSYSTSASAVSLFCAAVLIVVTFLPVPDWPSPIAAGYVYGIWAFPLVYGCYCCGRRIISRGPTVPARLPRC